MYEKMEINTEYITLGQFMKLANILESGGMVKVYLRDEGVLINGEQEHRRGRKLYPQDVIEIKDAGSFIIIKEENE